MNTNNQVQTINSQVALNYNQEAIETFRIAMQNFHSRLNQQPAQESIDKTPDGKAGTILISHIEMLLDEYFFGAWETENFKWAVIANEIVGSIDLVCLHPVTNQKFRRVGAASIQIMVDKAPENVNKSQWALNIENKKSNALDMGFPKLKTECLKNAANSLGKLFGRDLNRKKFDTYKPLINRKEKEDERIKHLIDDAQTFEQMPDVKDVPVELADYYNAKAETLKLQTA